MKKTRIVIAGGGFAGLHAAKYLDKTLARKPEIEVTLVSRENFILFTPMLHEVAGHMFVTQSLQFRHMTRRASRFIERPIYEHNHSEEAAAQRDARHDGQHDRQASIQAIIGSEVIPTVKPELFRERKELGICDRSAAFRHHRSDFCVAGFRSRGCAERISAAHRKLSASTKILSRPIAQDLSVNVTATATTQQATVVVTEEQRKRLIELRERLLAERAH